MNAANIRKARNAGCPSWILVHAASYECPEGCDAITNLRRDRKPNAAGGRTWRLNVEHDHDCPELARHRVGVA
jgi:hypothetical protein